MRPWGDLFAAGPDKEILVFPKLGPGNESTRKGVHLAGEAAGVPLLKNGLNMGAETVRAIAPLIRGRAAPENGAHLVVVGAGASGLAAALEAKAQGLSCLVLEQSRMLDTIESFHRGKPVFAEPSTVANASGLWFEECAKEELLVRWKKAVAEAGIEILAPHRLKNIRDGRGHLVAITDKGEFPCLRVILATGKKGEPRRLGIPGEDLDKVHASLADPDEYRDQDIAVVGAGDVAAETALALCDRNRVTLLVRREAIDRPKKRNRDALHAAADQGRLAIRTQTKPVAITREHIEIESRGERETLANHAVFCALGSDLPLPLMRRLGIRLESDWTVKRFLALALVLALVVFYYLWKKEFLKGFLFPESWAMWSGDALGLYGWTSSVSRWTHGVLPQGPALWTGALYSALVLGFGLNCLRKYRADPFQRKRYVVIIISQVFFLWVLPEIVFQGLLALPDGWRSYGLVIPAPLYVWNFHDPLAANLFWLVWFMLFTFAGVPLYSKFTGKMYCSWACGCGCLAETLGDRWRHLAPRGKRARAWEALGQWTVLALVACLVILGLLDAQSPAWTVQEVLVDLLLAGIVGVTAYPFWGNRIWCRFLCPLSRVMHAAAANTGSRRKISCGTHCIECGLCSKYCQMGIPVMELARNAEDFDNRTTSCIQCGVCVSVCPVRNLQHMEWDEALWERTVRLGPMIKAR